MLLTASLLLIEPAQAAEPGGFQFEAGASFADGFSREPPRRKRRTSQEAFNHSADRERVHHVHREGNTQESRERAVQPLVMAGDPRREIPTDDREAEAMTEFKVPTMGSP
jgi:hypothetical protein